MPACPYCSCSELTRDGHDHGRGHRFPRDSILLAVRHSLQLGAAAERIAGILAGRGINVSGRTILRWVQKFGPALSKEIRRYRKPVCTTWLVDETYVKILGNWHYLYRGVDQDGQVLDCWLSHTRDLAAAEAFFRRTINSTGCTPEHIVIDKATFYPSAIRTCAPTRRAWGDCHVRDHPSLVLEVRPRLRRGTAPTTRRRE